MLRSLEVGSLEADYQLLTEWARMNKKRSLLLLVTSITNPAGLESIHRALEPVKRKHLPLVFAIADRELAQIAAAKATNLTSAYTIAAASDQLEQVSQRAQSLTRLGIECIHCDVHQLSDRMRSKYYELKMQGRL